MTTLLRNLTNRHTTWTSPPSWLPADDVVGDALNDLSTRENVMSMFELSAGVDERRVAAALTARRTQTVHFVDFALIQREELERLGLDLQTTGGNTADEGVNGCHVNIVNISARALFSLVDALRATAKFGSIGPNELSVALAGSVSGGFIDAGELSERNMERIRRLR